MPTQNLLRLLLLLKRVGNSLLQIWELTFGPKTKLFQTSSTRVGQDFEVEVQARFWSWSLFSILPLMFCRGYEVESWSRFWSILMCQNTDCSIKFESPIGMRDRRKELIKQLLQEKTGKEEELLATNPASNRVGRSIEAGKCFRLLQAERVGLKWPAKKQNLPWCKVATE